MTRARNQVTSGSIVILGSPLYRPMGFYGMLSVKQDQDMPRGPKGEKRPADVNARAVMIGKIATGEIEDVTTDDGKNAAAMALGRMGGKARAKGLSAKRRRDIAKRAAKSRWAD
jgi:hypothetical protein